MDQEIFISTTAKQRTRIEQECPEVIEVVVHCQLPERSKKCRLQVSKWISHSQLNCKLKLVDTTVFLQIKRMIQSSARNSILGIYGWIQLIASCHWLILGWSNLHQYQEWSSQLSLLCDNKEQFPGKRATVFLQSDDAATYCTFLCDNHSRVAFISINDGWKRYVYEWYSDNC